MEAVKQQLFHELWPEIRASHTLETSITTFLTYLQSQSESICFSQNWYLLARQNRDVLFDEVGRSLSASPSGYDIILGYVQRDNLHWLFEKFTKLERVQRATQQTIQKALKYSNIPSQPKFYIHRHSMINKLKTKILDMSSSTDTKINVYGMDGIGKTNLIAACLRDPEILLKSNYKVYWIDLNHHAEGDLLDSMYKLYHKLQIDDPTLADLPRDNPGNIELMKVRLSNLFRRDAYLHAIIVLDNVTEHRRKAIEYFGVCRLIIISQERFDLNERVCHEHLLDAFTYEETMDVFRMALEGDVVPNGHLEDIIDWCRGDLITTILCANVMVERRSSLLNKGNSAEVWERFKKSLCKKDSKVITKRNSTIELRLSSLDDNLRAQYLDLAIFDTDVNITPNALAMLWDCKLEVVDDVMVILRDKSFAVREYNELIDSYVYGVNHIYLNYLRITSTNLRDKHWSLINAYKEKHHKYHKFLDDNYIYQYIGYHLHNAGAVEEFEIYMDLKFIEAKIRATGIADVLRDFDLYYEHITRQNEANELLLKELAEFIKHFGQNIENYPRTNIMQSALQLPSDSLVHQLALQDLKRTDQFGLYFDWLLPKKTKHYIRPLTVKQNLEVACFTHNDPNYLLIGTADGVVQLWDQVYDKVLQEFKGHTDKITYLRALDKKFLSISQDGTAKVWKMDNKSRRNSFVQNISHNGEMNMNIPSPACIKQKNYQDFFGTNFSVSVDNQVTYAAEGDSIISADFSNNLLVAGTAKGKLMLWQNEVQVFEKDLMTRIIAVQFSNDYTYIYVARETDVLVYNASTQEFISKACCRDAILSLHTLQCETVDEFVVVQKERVIKCGIKSVKGERFDIEKKIIMTNAAANTCSSMTDKYLVIGSSDKIYMWDLKEQRFISEFDTQYGQVVCIDATTNWDDQSVEILLTSFEDKSVKLWHINPAETSQQQAEKVDAFTAYWRADSKDFTTAIVRRNKLTILENNESIEVETSDAIVKVVTFNSHFVYGLECGKVYMCNHGVPTKIMNLPSNISYLGALDNLVLAATAKGVLLVYYNESAHKLRDECRGDLHDEIICCFDMFNMLVVVSQRKISYWNYEFDAEEVLHVSKDGNLCGACVSPDDRLCVTFDNSFKLISFDSKTFKIVNCIVKKTQSAVTACCFSADSKYLALGTQSGEIEVFSVDCLTLLTVLRLHSAPVHFMQFSHEGPILLSLAEQMAWWNVKLAETQLSAMPRSRSFRSRSNSGKSPGKKPLPLTNQLTDLDLTDMVMLAKRGRFDMEYLLAAIKLHGVYASHVVCADAFRAYLCVDNMGNLYNMRMLDEAKMALTPLVQLPKSSLELW